MKIAKSAENIDDLPYLVLMSHGELAYSVLNSAKLIAGDIPNVVVLGLEEGDNPMDYRKEFVTILQEIPERKLVLVDLFGGTPSNTSLFATTEVKEEFDIVSGLNLPMFLETLAMRKSCSYQELTKVAEEAGVQGVCNVKQMIGRK